jgi:hypothetical protein
MKTVNGIIIGLIIGAAVGGWLGVNYGRGVPLDSNPFKEPTLAERAQWKAEEIYDDTKRAIDEELSK